MRGLLKSSMSMPSITLHSPPEQVHGRPTIRPSGMPYSPFDGTPIDTQSPAGVPSTQSRMWSMAALAAEATDEPPRASMMAAPRVCTVGMKVSATQASSEMASQALFPATLACTTSGYCVAEWLPQMVIFVTSDTCTPVFWATCVIARL